MSTEDRARPHGAIGGPVYAEQNSTRWNGFLFVGEAPGVNEIRMGRPFVGPAGRLLDEILGDCRVERAASIITNVFQWQPSWSADNEGKRRSNDIMNFFTSKEADGSRDLRPFRGRLLHASHRYQIDDLARLVAARKPRRIIALGGPALWALTGFDRVKEARGKVLGGLHSDAPVFPTWHTAHALHRKDKDIKVQIRADIAAATAE